MINLFLKKINLYKKYRKDNFVFVYQMGKVGSDSLCSSIGPEESEHIHTLYNGNPNSKFLSPDSFISKKKYELSLLFKRLIIKTSRFNKKIKIITLVREPSKRDPSMFFQDIDGFIRKERSISYDNYIRLNSGGVNELCKLYLARYDFDYGLDWMDNELKRFTGIDLYKESFENGVCIKSDKKFNILCLRVDKINSNKKIISDFVGKKIEIRSTNLSESKWYSNLYAEFLLELKLPEPLNDKYKQSKLSQWLS